MQNILIENLKIEDMIYEIRGKQVMLDSDLAKLYQCANGTRSVNLAVKRNLKKFPDNFYFQLNTEDIRLLQESFTKLEEKEKKNHLFYEGQVYDVYSLFIDLLSVAKKKIIIIDNYAGKELFDLLREINVPIQIVTSYLNEEAIKK